MLQKEAFRCTFVMAFQMVCKLTLRQEVLRHFACLASTCEKQSLTSETFGNDSGVPTLNGSQIKE